MQVRNPHYRSRVASVVEDAGFVRGLGLRLDDTGPGWCETTLPLRPDHQQQDGYVHAGVQATIADHTAGCAAFTVLAADQLVLSIEFKINLLRPAHGDSLRCRADLLKAGGRVIVAESAVYNRVAGADEQLCAKATVTLAVLPAPG